MRQMQQMAANMDPAQMAQMQGMMNNMSPEQMRQMQQQVPPLCSRSILSARCRLDQSSKIKEPDCATLRDQAGGMGGMGGAPPQPPPPRPQQPAVQQPPDSRLSKAQALKEAGNKLHATGSYEAASVKYNQARRALGGEQPPNFFACRWKCGEGRAAMRRCLLFQVQSYRQHASFHDVHMKRNDSLHQFWHLMLAADDRLQTRPRLTARHSSRRAC